MADLNTGINLAKLFLGSSGSSTTSEDVSTEKANAVAKAALESTQGLAAVAGGQRSAGLYNSSTNQLLTNDLLSRISANTAALSKSTTTSQKVNPQVNPLSALGGLAGLQLASKSGLLSALGLGAGTAGSTAAAAAQSEKAIEAIKQSLQGVDTISKASEAAATVSTAAEAASGAAGAVDVAGAVGGFEISPVLAALNAFMPESVNYAVSEITGGGLEDAVSDLFSGLGDLFG